MGRQDERGRHGCDLEPMREVHEEGACEVDSEGDVGSGAGEGSGHVP